MGDGHGRRPGTGLSTPYCEESWSFKGIWNGYTDNWWACSQFHQL